MLCCFDNCNNNDKKTLFSINKTKKKDKTKINKTNKVQKQQKKMK